MTYIFLILLILLGLHNFDNARIDTEPCICQFELLKAKAELEKEVFYQARFQYISVFVSGLLNLRFRVVCNYHYVKISFSLMMLFIGKSIWP